MPDIQSLVELLKSNNPNKRYDACEQLRVSRQPLPQEAIEALRPLTKDKNVDVADAAQRALKLHDPALITIQEKYAQGEDSKDLPKDQKEFYKILWQIGFSINILVLIMSCSFTFTHMLGMWACIWANFPIIYSVISVIALGVSLYLSREEDFIPATYFAFAPIIGWLLWAAVNLGSGCFG